MTEEPPFNLYCRYRNGEFRAMVIMRGAVRSHHYYAEGEDHLAISPGAADMAGVFVAPFESDFEKAREDQLEAMIAEVTISKEKEQLIINRLQRRAPKIDIGIVSAKEIEFEFRTVPAARR